jgi:hypothetical protein
LRHGLLAAALVEDAFERALRVPREVQRHRLVDRRDAVQDDAPDAVRMPAQIDERGAGAVRNAEQVEGLVAERRANVVEIVRGDRGRVEREVGGRLETHPAAPRRVGRMNSRRKFPRSLFGPKISQASEFDFPVPRWSTSRMSCRSRIRASSSARLEASLAAASPGPPSRNVSASGAAGPLVAGRTTTFSSIRRPLPAARFSQTERLPQRPPPSTPGMSQGERVSAGLAEAARASRRNGARRSAASAVRRPTRTL